MNLLSNDSFLCNHTCTRHSECAIKTYEAHEFDNTEPFGLNGWTGWARLVSCHDGDTITAIIIFFGVPYKVKIRVNGIDTPEINVPNTKHKALEARDALLRYLTGLNTSGMKKNQIKMLLNESVYLVWIVCHHSDKYGRILCDVYNTADARAGNVAEMLVGAGLAKTYHGRARNTTDES